jgi:hypothetical protein
VGIHGRVSRSPGQVLTVTIWDMLTSLWVTEALGETKVNYVDVVLLFANSDQEVVWFDISVQEMTRMDKFNALKHLIS